MSNDRQSKIETYGAAYEELTAALWSHSIQHPENGRMTMDDWLGVYARHVSDHVAQVDRILADWQGRQGPTAAPND